MSFFYPFYPFTSSKSDAQKCKLALGVGNNFPGSDIRISGARIKRAGAIRERKLSDGLLETGID